MSHGAPSQRPLLAAWVSLLLLLGPPPLAAGANPDPVVVSAYTDAAGLYFEAPVPLPWESWLPADLQPASLARDAGRRRELFAQRSDFGFSEVAFFRPMPPDLQGRSYHLLDPSGARPIRPTGLRGTARIEWDDSGEFRAVHAFGYVIAADPGAGPGGFVLVSEQPDGCGWYQAGGRPTRSWRRPAGPTLDGGRRSGRS